MSPQRIRYHGRTRGWRLPAGAIYVGRPTIWGNPFRVGQPLTYFEEMVGWITKPPLRPTAADVVAWYEYVRWHDWHLDTAVPSGVLWGHDLACWCPLDSPCHADVLLRWANAIGPIPQPALPVALTGTPWDRSPGRRPWTDKRTWPARASVTD